MMMPLATESFEVAWFRWTMLNHLLAWATLFLLLWGYPALRRSYFVALGVLLLAFSAPWWRSLAAGQLNGVLLFLLTAALVLVARRRTMAAAVLIAIAAHIKLAPIFLFLFFVWKRDLRALLAGTAALVVIFIITLFYIPFSTQLQYTKLLGKMGYGSSTWSQYGQDFQVEPANQSPSALYYRLFSKNPKTWELVDAPALAKALSILTSLLLCALVAWRVRLRPRTGEVGEETSAWLLFWMLMLLLPSLMWDHYLSQLFPAYLLTALALVRRPKAGDWKVWLAIVAWLVSAWLIEHFVFFWQPEHTKGWGILAAAGKLYGTLVLGALLLWLHPLRELNSEPAP